MRPRYSGIMQACTLILTMQSGVGMPRQRGGAGGTLGATKGGDGGVTKGDDGAVKPGS